MNKIWSISPCVMAFITIFMPLIFISPINAGDISHMNEKDLNIFIKQYLMENPEIIIRSLENFQSKQEKITAKYQDKVLEKFITAAINNNKLPSFGAKDADIAIIEFSDYQCGYCKRSFPKLMDMVNDDGNIKVIFIELPILGDMSSLAAITALAANKQGKYIEFHTALMQSRGRLNNDKIFNIAEKLQLNMEKLNADIASHEIKNNISINIQNAQKLGINGTPAFIIGDQLFKGAIPRDDMENAVRLYRSKIK